MKLVNRLMLFTFMFSAVAHACPTCIGRLEKNTPPFFSAEYDEHYKASAYPTPDTDQVDDLEEDAQ